MGLRRPAALLAAAVSLAGCGPGVATLSVPPPPRSLPVTTTAPPPTVEGASVSLPVVPGSTTTTLPSLGPGRATIVGAVHGPDGAVVGATVLLQRVVGGRAVGTEVVTTRAGAFKVAGVLGGVYRIRAWDPPTLALSRPLVVWVPGSGHEQVTLTLSRFGREPTVTAAVAPDPPVVGRAVTVAVLVTRATVTARGHVTYAPDPGVSVQLIGASWAVNGAGTRVTGPTGRVDFLAACEAAGRQPVIAAVGIITVDLPTPACVPPPTTTTTTTARSTTTTSRKTTTTTGTTTTIPTTTTTTSPTPPAATTTTVSSAHRQ